MKIPHNIADQIRNRTLTAREAAKYFNITEQHMCRLLKEQKIKRIPGITHATREKVRELLAARTEHRKSLAAQVKARRKSLEQAAIEANCSIRTIYRYL